MCIAIYKPKNIDFPSKEILQNCFSNNPDGAGYMYTVNNCVHIRKGFMKFYDFWQSLKDTREKHGDRIPFVLHFRISTQAGVRRDCCHPYPLSDKMQDLRALKCKTKIGIAHNGIISLTSNGYHKTITYNDTMQFITDYLSLIIRDKNYYKNDNTRLLIERLAGSRLAILDSEGHCELIGNGWSEENGVYYSNTSYKERARIYTAYDSTLYNFNEYDFTLSENAPKSKTACDYYEWYLNQYGVYEFDDCDCPLTMEGDDSYCGKCANYYMCYYGGIEDENDGD